MASHQNAKPVLPLSERTVRAFWDKADCRAPNECWPWKRTLNVSGYGNLGVHGRGFIRAHRVAWALANGRDPGALCVLHRCDNRRCVNPAHLFLGTVRDNWHDCIVKGRAKFPHPPSPYCQRGHEFTPANSIIEKDGYRRCRECTNARKRRYRHAARG